jgi:transposase
VTSPLSRRVPALCERPGLAEGRGGAGQQEPCILWAVMTKGDRYDPNHISVKPGAPQQHVGVS